MLREIALDTETTGLEVADGHRIIEIGCVEMIGHLRTSKTFHAYLNPQRLVLESATRIHGISNEFLSNKPLFVDIACDFLSFIADSPLVIHNAAFDLSFINHELKLLNLPTIQPQNSIDTISITKKLFPGSSFSLDALCKRFSISTSARQKHGALLDAELLADVYLELMGGSQLTIDLSSSIIKTNKQLAVKKKELRKRVFKISTQEIKAHRLFLRAHLKNPIWDKYLQD
jgi:DNA polymerase-3 subunit epsilon